MGVRVLDLRNWLRDAACKGVGFDFVPLTETTSGLAQAQEWCNICPVREECLMTAMRNPAWSGYWGGTTTKERSKLKASKHRAKCPLCLSVNVVTIDRSQVCIACGRSWPTGGAPVPKQEKRPSERGAGPRESEVKVMGEVL